MLEARGGDECPQPKHSGAWRPGTSLVLCCFSGGWQTQSASYRVGGVELRRGSLWVAPCGGLGWALGPLESWKTPSCLTHPVSISSFTHPMFQDLELA